MLALKKALFDSGWRNIARKVPAGCVLSLPGLPEGRSQATIPDISGNGNNGTITGATWVRLPSGMDGVLNFTETSNDVITVTSAASLNFAAGEAFWIELWFKSSSATDRYFCGKYDNVASVYYLLRASNINGWRLELKDTVATAVTSNYGSVINDGVWHYLIAARTTNLSLFMDGAADGAPVADTTLNLTNTANLIIGKQPGVNVPGFQTALFRLHRGTLDATIPSFRYNQERHLFGV